MENREKSLEKLGEKYINTHIKPAIIGIIVNVLALGLLFIGLVFLLIGAPYKTISLMTIIVWFFSLVFSIIIAGTADVLVLLFDLFAAKIGYDFAKEAGYLAKLKRKLDKLLDEE